MLLVVFYLRRPWRPRDDPGGPAHWKGDYPANLRGGGGGGGSVPGGRQFPIGRVSARGVINSLRPTNDESLLRLCFISSSFPSFLFSVRGIIYFAERRLARDRLAKTDNAEMWRAAGGAWESGLVKIYALRAGMRALRFSVLRAIFADRTVFVCVCVCVFLYFSVIMVGHYTKFLFDFTG